MVTENPCDVMCQGMKASRALVVGLTERAFVQRWHAQTIQPRLGPAAAASRGTPATFLGTDQSMSARVAVSRLDPVWLICSSVFNLSQRLLVRSMQRGRVRIAPALKVTCLHQTLDLLGSNGWASALVSYCNNVFALALTSNRHPVYQPQQWVAQLYM